MEEITKSVKSYTKMFRNAIKNKNIHGHEDRVNKYSEKLTKMYSSKQFEEHNQYPSTNAYKIYAVIAMCLILKEEGMTKAEIIDFVNDAFRKNRKLVRILTKAIDAMPNAYQIAEKWNKSEHEKRIQDGSIIYEKFQVEDGRIEYRISKCMYIEMFDAYGIRDLCKIFCMTDTRAYAGLTKHVQFTRYSDLLDGDACHDVITRKS